MKLYPNAISTDRKEDGQESARVYLPKKNANFNGLITVPKTFGECN